MRRSDAVWCLIGAAGLVWWGVDHCHHFAPDTKSAILAALLVFGLPLVLLAVFLVTVWPTPYRLDHASGHLVRITRLTGKVAILTPLGWTPLDHARRLHD